MLVDILVSFPYTSHGIQNVFIRNSTAPASIETSINGRLYYCSGKEKEGTDEEASLVASERIEKDAIRGHLICCIDCSTYLTIPQTRTPIDKMDISKLGLKSM
jgi:hypothetical protein